MSMSVYSLYIANKLKYSGIYSTQFEYSRNIDAHLNYKDGRWWSDQTYTYIYTHFKKRVLEINFNPMKLKYHFFVIYFGAYSNH